uniref:Sodium/hydrogen exchanger n=1 Tax=Caenorhabditis tropicalis TaxID=1561998 RepID=A0A1I7TZL0_9PELO
MKSLGVMQWNRPETPMLLGLWLLLIVGAKIGFHRMPRARHFFPESAVLIVLGLAAGFTVYEMWTVDLFLHPGCFVFACQNFYDFNITIVDTLLFSTVISAVDPVAVLSVFEEIHVNKLLYITVFGESLLNDAVTVVLYHSFHSMVRIGQAHLIYQDYTMSMMNFFLVSGGGILVGVVFAVVAALGVKIVVCGLCMKSYVTGSMEERADITVKYTLKTLSSCCEAIIFVFLGFSIFSKDHKWDVGFAIVSVLTCFAVRFLVVFILSWAANKWRMQKISLRDQTIMAFGGLRGAICFGLVLTIDGEVVPAKPIMISTTLVVIVFTVFIQGTMIKPLVSYLNVKIDEAHDKSLFQSCMEHSFEDTMCGVEAIIGSHGQYYWKNKMDKWNTQFLEPALTRQDMNRGRRLVKKLTDMTTDEQREALLNVIVVEP